MHFGPRSAIVVVALADIWTGGHFVVSASYAHQSTVADAIDWCVQEWDDWTVWVEVHDVEL